MLPAGLPIRHEGVTADTFVFIGKMAVRR